MTTEKASKSCRESVVQLRNLERITVVTESFEINFDMILVRDSWSTQWILGDSNGADAWSQMILQNPALIDSRKQPHRKIGQRTLEQISWTFFLCQKLLLELVDASTNHTCETFRPYTAFVRVAIKISRLKCRKILIDCFCWHPTKSIKKQCKTKYLFNSKGSSSSRRDAVVLGHRDSRRCDDVTDQAQHNHPHEADPNVHDLFGQPARCPHSGTLNSIKIF